MVTGLDNEIESKWFDRSLNVSCVQFIHNTLLAIYIVNLHQNSFTSKVQLIIIYKLALIEHLGTHLSKTDILLAVVLTSHLS